MTWWAWVIVGVAVVAIVAFAGWMAARSKRTAALQEHFGSEYDRSLLERGSRSAAEADLAERERRRKRYRVHGLDGGAREQYSERWQAVQARFVEAPTIAVREADELVVLVMGDMGYPIAEFDQRAADVSVDHPDVVENYRAAHAVAVADDGTAADTEALRRAMTHYRALFAELLAYGEPHDAGAVA